MVGKKVLTVKELRAELEKRGLDVTGKKSALEQRLNEVCRLIFNLFTIKSHFHLFCLLLKYKDKVIPPLLHLLPETVLFRFHKIHKPQPSVDHNNSGLFPVYVEHMLTPSLMY